MLFVLSTNTSQKKTVIKIIIVDQSNVIHCPQLTKKCWKSYIIWPNLFKISLLE